MPFASSISLVTIEVKSPPLLVARQYLGVLHLVDRNIPAAIVELEAARQSDGSYGPSALIGYIASLSCITQYSSAWIRYETAFGGIAVSPR